MMVYTYLEDRKAISLSSGQGNLVNKHVITINFGFLNGGLLKPCFYLHKSRNFGLKRESVCGLKCMQESHGKYRKLYSRHSIRFEVFEICMSLMLSSKLIEYFQID